MIFPVVGLFLSRCFTSQCFWCTVFFPKISVMEVVFVLVDLFQIDVLFEPSIIALGVSFWWNFLYGHFVVGTLQEIKILLLHVQVMQLLA